jgi:hypothetical protein
VGGVGLLKRKEFTVLTMVRFIHFQISNGQTDKSGGQNAFPAGQT